jgi:Ca2+-binding EF-hand superfamily protein
MSNAKFLKLDISDEELDEYRISFRMLHSDPAGWKDTVTCEEMVAQFHALQCLKVTKESLAQAMEDLFPIGDRDRDEPVLHFNDFVVASHRQHDGYEEMWYAAFEAKDLYYDGSILLADAILILDNHGEHTSDANTKRLIQAANLHDQKSINFAELKRMMHLAPLLSLQQLNSDSKAKTVDITPIVNGILGGLGLMNLGLVQLNSDTSNSKATTFDMTPIVKSVLGIFQFNSKAEVVDVTPLLRALIPGLNVFNTDLDAVLKGALPGLGNSQVNSSNSNSDATLSLDSLKSEIMQLNKKTEVIEIPVTDILKGILGLSFFFRSLR